MELKSEKSRNIAFQILKINEDYNLINHADYKTLFMMISSYGEKNISNFEGAGSDRLLNKVSIKSNNSAYVENLILKFI